MTEGTVVGDRDAVRRRCASDARFIIKPCFSVFLTGYSSVMQSVAVAGIPSWLIQESRDVLHPTRPTGFLYPWGK